MIICEDHLCKDLSCVGCSIVQLFALTHKVYWLPFLIATASHFIWSVLQTAFQVRHVFNPVWGSVPFPKADLFRRVCTSRRLMRMSTKRELMKLCLVRRQSTTRRTLSKTFLMRYCLPHWLLSRVFNIHWLWIVNWTKQIKLICDIVNVCLFLGNA